MRTNRPRCDVGSDVDVMWANCPRHLPHHCPHQRNLGYAEQIERDVNDVGRMSASEILSPWELVTRIWKDQVKLKKTKFGDQNRKSLKLLSL